MQIDSKKYYWLPSYMWCINDGNLSINNKIYYGEKYLEIFPEFYFMAQRGIVKNEMEKVFGQQGIYILEKFIEDRIVSNAVPFPPKLFESYQYMLADIYDENLIFNKDYYNSYRDIACHRELNNAGVFEQELEFQKEWYPEYLLHRKSIRKFKDGIKIEYNKFCKMINILGHKSEGEAKYFYPSAGGLYTIDVYICIKEKRVEGIGEGTYNYIPCRHSLQKISDKIILENTYFFSNREIHKSSAFSILFCLNVNVVAAKYGEYGIYLGIIEVGILMELCTNWAEKCGIATCCIGDMDYRKLTQALQQKENIIPMQSIECGYRGDEFEC